MMQIPSTSNGTDGDAARCRVLIVDDSAVTRAMVRRSVMLSGVDADIEEAADGMEALAELRAAQEAGRSYDVCFLDLNMPRMGGVEVATEACGQGGVSTRVVIVSSESMSARIKQLQEAGVSGYIKKPFKPEEIRGVLARVLEPKSAIRAA